MMGFKKYIGLSTLLACGVGYHAFSTREQCALLLALSCFVPFPLTCVLDVRCAVCVVMRKGTFLSSLATGSCCCTKALLKNDCILILQSAYSAAKAGMNANEL